MAKITGQYLRIPIGVVLLLALFLCGMSVRPSVRAWNMMPRTTWSAPRNTPGRRIEHMLLRRYEGLRFVYQVETQLSELHTEEAARQRNRDREEAAQ